MTISGDGDLIEIFISSTGVFTTIKTSPSVVSYIADFSENWQTIDQLETALLSQMPDASEDFER